MSQKDAQQQGQTPAAPAEPKSEPKGEKVFDEGYVRELRAENAAARKRAQEAEARVQEFEQAGASEVEKLTTKLTKAQQEAEDARTELLRYRVGAEKGLDPELMPFLTGSSKEELEEKADVLLSKVGKPEPKSEFDGGAREPAPEPKTPEDAHSEFVTALLTGRQST